MEQLLGWIGLAIVVLNVASRATTPTAVGTVASQGY